MLMTRKWTAATTPGWTISLRKNRVSKTDAVWDALASVFLMAEWFLLGLFVVVGYGG